MPGPGQTTSGSKGWTEMDQKSENYTKESFPGYSGLLLEVRGYMSTKNDLHTFPHMQQETLCLPAMSLAALCSEAMLGIGEMALTRSCTGWWNGWQAAFLPQSQLQSLLQQNRPGDHWALSQNKDFACSEVLFLNEGYWSGCWPWEKKSKYNLQLRVTYKVFALRLIPTVMVMQLDTLQ